MRYWLSQKVRSRFSLRCYGIYITFFVLKSLKSDVYFSTSPFRLASFQVLTGHIMLVATALDRAVLDAWGYNSEQSRSSCPPLPAWTKHLHPLQVWPGCPGFWPRFSLFSTQQPEWSFWKLNQSKSAFCFKPFSRSPFYCAWDRVF